MAVVYGRSWWGKKWLEAFNGIDDDNRLPRGRSYANSGKAYDIKINGNIITAKVRGSRPQAYKVAIALNEFNDIDKNIIQQIITGSPNILAALINKQLPESFLDKLEECKIKLFPRKWDEIEASCSCPDYAVPCKHIAAVIYLLSSEIDKNPFIIFDIHNCNLLQIINDFGEGKLARAQKILSIEEMLKPYQDRAQPTKQLVLDDIDLSIIPDLGEQICNILTSDPLFYKKDFREILSAAYRYWRKYPSLLTAKSQFKNKEEATPEEIFAAKWGNPENWSDFYLVINDCHHLIEVNNGCDILFGLDSNSAQNLVRFLNDLPNSLLHKLNPNLRLLHLFDSLARKLISCSAFMPQILQNARGDTLIRWIPAFFDPTINSICNKLSALCEGGLVKYKNINLDPKEQLKSALAIILCGYIDNNLSAVFAKEKNDDIFKMFFAGRSYKFNDFTNKQIPTVIDLWLSRLYLSEKTHKIYLAIEDHLDGFELDLQLILEENKAPITLPKLLVTKDSEAKLRILSDLAILFEYIPQLEKLSDQKQKLLFNLNDFEPLFISILPLLRAIGIIIILPKSLQKILKPQLKLNLSAKNKIKADSQSFLNLQDLLQFNWQIAIGDKKVTLEEFKKMLNDSRGLVKMADQYVLLDDREVEILLKKLDRMPKELNHFDLMQAALSSEFDGATVALDEQLTKLFSRLNNYKPAPIPHNLKACLRPYQISGFSWLTQNIEIGFGSILADDMGLGKTLQVIAAILHCKNSGLLEKSKVLIVAPTGVLTNWQKEIERFAPDLKALIYHGQNRELKNDYDLLITSYGLARRDSKELNKVKWFLLVIDEAQNIKNYQSQQSKAIKAISAIHKMAMSGTPVENRLLEYWSIFDFTNKYYLGAPQQFKTRFAIPIERNRDKSCLQQFLKITGPFMLRRLKSDKNIIADLPDKIENNRYCFLTTEQAALYQEVINLNMKKIESSNGIERQGLVFKLINDLKQICNHPSQYKKQKSANKDQSGKAQMLEEILIDIDDLAEKSLIFTQYTQMGEIIVQLLAKKFKSTVPFLHGGLSRKARDEIIDDFQNLSGAKILIISLKAGGTGLNLTAANHVIHYDLWWNPAVEAQATDRAYRIGQKRNVMVHRLLTSNSFEERIDAMIQSKKELANLTVGSGENWITKLSNDQLREIVEIRN